MAHTNRRDFLALGASTGVAAGLHPLLLEAQASMPTRPIPSTGERLPVVGLGSSKPVQEVATRGADNLAAILLALADNGGKLVDTWPRNPSNDAVFGEVINRPELRDRLFITTKIDQIGAQAGIEQFENSLVNYRRDSIDLAQIFSLTDVDTHWPNLRRWKDEERARYIGVTVADASLYDALERFLANESPDFVQVNFSITERESERRLLPMLSDRGIGVIVNRPFMNGSYFDRLETTPLPEWTAEFDCETWAQFSLKYILSNEDFTSVLTETSNPLHMEENARTASSALPDRAARGRMRDFIDGM
jgi:diketogulonate reductase-like aldo/keto reductase